MVDAIEPWLREVVIIGGWAHQLYRIHPLAQKIDYVPLTTLGTDVAVPACLPVKDQDLRERLLANGFEEERLGEDKPPATHYRLRHSDTGFYAEFLTPLMGSGDGRDGKPKATRRVAGVVSQQLRYLEVLLRDPWTVTVGPDNGFPFRIAKVIRITASKLSPRWKATVCPTLNIRVKGQFALSSTEGASALLGPELRDSSRSCLVPTI